MTQQTQVAGKELKRIYPMTKEPIPPEWLELLARLDRLEQRK